jgi:hypothetical protein
MKAFAGLLLLSSLLGCVPKVETTARVFHHEQIPFIKCVNVINTKTTTREEALKTLEPCRHVIEQNMK